MSITSCFLVLFLCLSIHACTARRLGAVYTDNKHANKLHFSTKNDDTQKLEHAHEVKFKSAVEKEKERTTSGAIDQTNKHVVSVSWKVPHRKHGDNLPGFNQLDYEPPKTHPPSHN